MLVAVRNTWQACRCQQLESDAEDIWISIQNINNEKMYLCCAYIPPGDNSDFLSFTNSMYTNHKTFLNRAVTIVGDFNLASIEWVDVINESFFRPARVDERSSSLVDAFSYFQFMQFNNVKNANDKVLDLLLCNRSILLDVCRSELPLVVEDMHHPSLEVFINTVPNRPLSNNSCKIYNFHRADYLSINRALADISWNGLFSGKSPDECVNLLYLEIDKVIQKFVPSFKSKGKFSIYYKPDTIKTIIEKNKLHKKYKQYNDQVSYVTYFSLRRRSKQLIKRDFSDFTRTMETQITYNAKKFWNYVSNKKKHM